MVAVGVLVGVDVRVSVGVGVSVLVGVREGVKVIVGDNVVVGRNVLVARGVTRITILNSVAVGVAVGSSVGAGVGVKSTGAGETTIPMKPRMTRSSPLAELIIKSLGYFINLEKPFYDTVDQFAIQVKVIIGGFTVLGTDDDFVRLVIEIVNLINRTVRTICLSTKANPLIGDKKESGIFSIEMIFILTGSLNCQTDRSNSQNHAFPFAQNQVFRI